MSKQEGYGNNKRSMSLTHKTHRSIDRLTAMVSKLLTQDSGQNRPFNPKIYQGRKRGQCRNNYYDWGRQ